MTTDSVSSAGQFYRPDRLYGAPQLFLNPPTSQWFRRMRPNVLSPDMPTLLTLNLSIFSSITSPAQARPRRCRRDRRHRSKVADEAIAMPRLYNPSIARAPDHLHSCARCEYIAAVRADSLHQCTRAGAVSGGFLGTAIVALDAELSVVAWAWLYTSCNPRPIYPTRDEVPPPWRCAQRDVRLLNVGGRLLATYHGSLRAASETFVVEHVQLHARARADGSVVLRAWAMQEDTAAATMATWLAGRNQALFASISVTSSRKRGDIVLMTQPWIHLVARLGQPAWYWGQRASAFDRRRRHWYEKLQQVPCAPPATTRFCSFMHRPRLVHNDTTLEVRLGQRTHLDPLLSTTVHLLRIARDSHHPHANAVGEAGRATAPRSCEAFLGIGHLHRRPSNDGPAWRRAVRDGCAPRPNNTFRFGSQYTHFFYTIQPSPPHRLLATSGEFCLAAGPGADDCESVQFVSGLVGATPLQLNASARTRRHSRQRSPSPLEQVRIAERREVIISWGANDCEAKLARWPLDRVWSMLRAVDAGVDSCERVTF